MNTRGPAPVGVAGAPVSVGVGVLGEGATPVDVDAGVSGAGSLASAPAVASGQHQCPQAPHPLLPRRRSPRTHGRSRPGAGPGFWAWVFKNFEGWENIFFVSYSTDS
jgi:hypothetical protein